LRKSLGIYPIKNRHTNKYEDAELFSMIDINNVNDFELEWKPLLEERKNNLKGEETTESANIQDAHWDWSTKAQVYNKRLDYNSFAIECSGKTQGLMFVKNVAYAREKSQLGKFIIHIVLVSTAPWNRNGFTNTPLYKGIGPLFLGAAISLSMSEQCEGRVGLHSLPQSESWYNDVCCMTNLGPDPKCQNLKYFEMTPEQAQAYINN